MSISFLTSSCDPWKSNNEIENDINGSVEKLELSNLGIGLDKFDIGVFVVLYVGVWIDIIVGHFSFSFAFRHLPRIHFIKYSLHQDLNHSPTQSLTHPLTHPLANSLRTTTRATKDHLPKATNNSPIVLVRYPTIDKESMSTIEYLQKHSTRTN